MIIVFQLLTLSATMFFRSLAWLRSNFGLSRLVPINADTCVHPNLPNSRFEFISRSRASYEAAVFAGDVSRLAQQLAIEATKNAALKIDPSMVFGQGRRDGLIRSCEPAVPALLRHPASKAWLSSLELMR